MLRLNPVRHPCRARLSRRELFPFRLREGKRHDCEEKSKPRDSGANRGRAFLGCSRELTPHPYCCSDPTIPGPGQMKSMARLGLAILVATEKGTSRQKAHP